MTIYIDSDYRCHTADAAGRTAIETNFFDGKCAEFIEGYRYVPSGETWTRGDGEVFSGEMIAPWKDLGEAYAAQAAYLEQLLAASQAQTTDMQAALEVLGVTE